MGKGNGVTGARERCCSGREKKNPNRDIAKTHPTKQRNPCKENPGARQITEKNNFNSSGVYTPTFRSCGSTNQSPFFYCGRTQSFRREMHMVCRRNTKPYAGSRPQIHELCLVSRSFVFPGCSCARTIIPAPPSIYVRFSPVFIFFHIQSIAMLLYHPTIFSFFFLPFLRRPIAQIPLLY